MGQIMVSDIMTRNLITIKPNTNLLNCARKMIKKRVGSLLIVDKKNNNRLVGFLSSDDILWALVKKSKKDLSTIRAIDISPRKLATIKPTASIEDIIKKMKRIKFEKLPVIKDGEVVGMITIRDILTFHPEIYPEMEEFSEIREEVEKLKRLETKTLREPKIHETNVMREGICEGCGNYDILYRVDSQLICGPCKNTM